MPKFIKATDVYGELIYLNVDKIARITTAITNTDSEEYKEWMEELKATHPPRSLVFMDDCPPGTGIHLHSTVEEVTADLLIV